MYANTGSALRHNLARPPISAAKGLLMLPDVNNNATERRSLPRPPRVRPHPFGTSSSDDFVSPPNNIYVKSPQLARYYDSRLARRPLWWLRKHETHTSSGKQLLHRASP